MTAHPALVALPRRLEAGFTLLEVLVVLALIGVMIGIAVLAIGDGGRGRAVENQALRLRGALALAAQESVLESRVLGAEIGPRGYRFYRLEHRRWVAFQGDPSLAAATLPQGLRLNLHLGGGPRPAGSDESRSGPQILFMASGEISPFSITLADSHSDARYRIAGEANGVLVLKDLESVQ